MKEIWRTEKSGLFFTVVWIILIGMVTQNWMIALVIPLVVYIIWIYNRLYKLEKWLSTGTKAGEVFDDNGFIGLIIRHLYLQKKTHNKRKKRTKEMLRRLKTNISALPDATVLLNQHLEIEWVNEPAQYLLGITRADSRQRIDNLIRHPDFQEYLHHPEAQANLEIQSPLDQTVILQVKVVSFGKNQRLIIIRNISDQKQLQEALKNFVANASHELQTPLTSIIGYLEILAMETGLSDTGKKSIAVLQQQSKRMEQLIKDLLMLSRVESYQLQPEEGDKFSVTECMLNVMSTIGTPCNHDHIRCDIADNIQLLGIQREIEGICLNLIENAIKHSPADTPVNISWQLNKQGEAVFTVIDKGNGISDQDLPHITDRYYRGSESTLKQISGSGLGLSIVQQAAHKHGASLKIDSKPRQGSTFSVTFPSYRTSQQNAATQSIASA